MLVILSMVQLIGYYIFHFVNWKVFQLNIVFLNSIFDANSFVDSSVTSYIITMYCLPELVNTFWRMLA